MSDIDSDAVVSPQGADYIPDDQVDSDVTFVDSGSVQTSLGIS